MFLEGSYTGESQTDRDGCHIRQIRVLDLHILKEIN